MLFTLIITHYLLYWIFSLGLIFESKPSSFVQRLPSRHVFFIISFNQLVVTPLAYVFFPGMEVSKSDTVFAPLLVVSYLPFHSIYFFLVHSLMHTPTMYRSIHSLHHEFPNTLPYHAFWCTPLEHAVLNMGSFFVGPAIIGFSHSSLALWTIMGTISTCLAHSGALRYRKRVHDLHHLSGRTNLSSGMFFMDKVFGSYQEPRAA